MTYYRPLAASQGRLFSRLTQEFNAGTLSTGARFFDGNIDRYVVFATVLRCSGPLAALAVGQENPFETGSKRISVSAVAASTYRPFETIRRHVNALIADGMVERDAGGLMVPARVLHEPSILAMLNGQHDWLVRLAEDAHALGFAIADTDRKIPYSHWHGIVATLDMALTALEFHAGRHTSWTELCLTLLTSVGNIHDFFHNPKHAQSYLHYHDLAPRHFRRPVTVRALTNALGISYSTALRHIGGMQKAGIVKRERGGLVITDGYIIAPRVIDGMMASAHRKMKILARLGALGFPFQRPTDAYVDGRPAWLDI